MVSFSYLNLKHLLLDSSLQESPHLATLEFGITIFILPTQTVVWVANRDAPINDTSRILSIDPNGNLVIHHNYSTMPIWSTNVSLPQSQRNSTGAVIAKLSNIANLVLMINNTKTVIWERHSTIPILGIWKNQF